jgi:hypothetical protein
MKKLIVIALATIATIGCVAKAPSIQYTTHAKVDGQIWTINFGEGQYPIVFTLPDNTRIGMDNYSDPSFPPHSSLTQITSSIQAASRKTWDDSITYRKAETLKTDAGETQCFLLTEKGELPCIAAVYQTESGKIVSLAFNLSDRKKIPYYIDAMYKAKVIPF